MGKADTKKALTIGILCITTYLANYYLRHILSVMTPKLIELGEFTLDHIGLLSSAYMLLYAVGQLVNGFLGDILSPKKMVVVGIAAGGISTMLFPFIKIGFLQILCFAVLGFALSMVRGPLVKTVSENTKPNQARVICVFLSFSSFAGPLIASLLAIINSWYLVFVVSGGVAVCIAAAAFVVLTALERRGIIHYQSSKGKGISSILSVFKIERIYFYMVISCLVEIVLVSISFWIPTYLTDCLGFEENTANTIFAVISALRSFMPFVTLALFRLTKERDISIMRVAYVISTVMFTALLFSPNKWVSLVLLLLALLAGACPSALIWNVFIPGLGKTGKVSSVNGVLDGVAYLSAAGANLLFASFMKNAGWNVVLIMWACIGIIGLLTTVIFRASDKKEPTETNE